MRRLARLGLTILLTGAGAGIGLAQVPTGSKPPIPMPLHTYETLRQNTPAALSQFGSDLPTVGTPGPKSRAPMFGANSTPSIFSPENAPVGSWQLISGPPGSPALSNPLVLTDGSVIAHISCSATWWKLTPNSSGSYANGTWSQIASLPSGYTPRFFSSSVLPDGRVIIEGGEYNTNCAAQWTNKGAIYDPLANTWTSMTPPSGWAQIGDSQATVLANGTYFQADCCDPGTKSALLNASTLTWTATGTGKFDYYDEEGWTLLPDGTVLTVDAYVGTGTCGTNTERYNPSTGAWTSAGNTPSILADCNILDAENGSRTFEMGPQVLMYNKKVIAFGANTKNVARTALYDTTSNTWAAGPNLPSTCGSSLTAPCTLADAPAALLPNGNVLFAASAGAFHAPTNFFEYDPSAGTYTGASSDSSITSFQVNFTILPTGQILEVDTDNGNVWLYNPSGSFNSSWRPVVTSVPTCVVPNGTYLASGNQLNGLSEGSNYGDDQISNTNYPIIRIVNNATGHVAYARTFNHSSRSVAANTPTSTNFKVASNTELGPSTLVVVANGIPSVSIPITVGSTGCSGGVATHDFDGNGKSDIAWRLNTGEAALWLMNGYQIANSAGYGAISTAWSIVGQRDFNGDGKHDWLWRDTSGNVAFWFMNGTQIASSIGIGAVSTAWTIVGTADFSGDGKGDILWRDNVGDVAMWLMNGSSISSSVGFGAVSTAWTIVGTGDFNGDGKRDILWRDSSGNVAFWFMNGTQIVSSIGIGAVSNSWTIIGTGDFNGDGKWDILWRDNVGDVAIWLMNGSSIMQSAGLGAVSTAWSILDTGDYNGDGKSDFLWRDSSGNIAFWFMNGVTVSSSIGIGAVNNAWVIQTAHVD